MRGVCGGHDPHTPPCYSVLRCTEYVEIGCFSSPDAYYHELFQEVQEMWEASGFISPCVIRG